MPKLKVLVADAHRLSREAVRAVLRSDRHLQLVGEVSTGLQAIEQTMKLRPDVTILDLRIPEFDGIEATKRIQAANPNTHVIILSRHDSEAVIRGVLGAGASGFVLKSELPNKLKTAVKAVCEGRRYLSPRVSEKLANKYIQLESNPDNRRSTYLTHRELEVAHLLSTGKSSKEIAAALRISIRTVETHRANIMRRMNVHSVTELLYHLFRHGLIETPQNESERIPRRNGLAEPIPSSP